MPTASDLARFAVVYPSGAHGKDLRKYFQDLRSPKGRFKTDPRGHESSISTVAPQHHAALWCPGMPRSPMHPGPSPSPIAGAAAALSSSLLQRAEHSLPLQRQARGRQLGDGI